MHERYLHFRVVLVFSGGGAKRPKNTTLGRVLPLQTKTKLHVVFFSSLCSVGMQRIIINRFTALNRKHVFVNIVDSGDLRNRKTCNFVSKFPPPV